jgi:hypothetical protein
VHQGQHAAEVVEERFRRSVGGEPSMFRKPGGIRFGQKNIPLFQSLAWVLFYAVVLCGVVLPWVEDVRQHNFLNWTTFLIYLIHPFGAFWMIYDAARNERKPLALIFLAFFPVLLCGIT